MHSYVDKILFLWEVGVTIPMEDLDAKKDLSYQEHPIKIL
jgi:hypothetical protein